MSVIRKLATGSKTQAWGEQIKENLEDFTRLITQIPTEDDESPFARVDRIKMLYVAIQHSKCPNSADDIYTHITRSMINLSMCYESLCQLKAEAAEMYYERALEEWTGARYKLSQAGVRLYHI